MATYTLGTTGTPTTPAGASAPVVDGSQASAARAHLAGGYSIPATGWNIVLLDTIDFDPEGSFGDGGGYYLAPRTGYYLATANVYFDNFATGLMATGLIVDASVVAIGYVAMPGATGGNGQFWGGNCTDILSVAAGEAIAVGAFGPYGAALNVPWVSLSVIQVA